MKINSKTIIAGLVAAAILFAGVLMLADKVDAQESRWAGPYQVELPVSDYSEEDYENMVLKEFFEGEFQVYGGPTANGWYFCELMVAEDGVWSFSCRTPDDRIFWIMEGDHWQPQGTIVVNPDEDDS